MDIFWEIQNGSLLNLNRRDTKYLHFNTKYEPDNVTHDGQQLVRITQFSILFPILDGLIYEDYEILETFFQSGLLHIIICGFDPNSLIRGVFCMKAHNPLTLEYIKRKFGTHVIHIQLVYNDTMWPFIKTNPLIGFGG